MQHEKSHELALLRKNCHVLEEQVKVLVRTELQLRRMKAELIQSKSIINEYNRNLENIVDDRTRKLMESNRKLQQEVAIRRKKEQELKVLEETIIRSERMDAASILAGSVAHELNNLLTGIIGYPNLILKKLEDNSPHIHHLKAIRESGEKAATVVKDLVTLSRGGVASGKPLNLNDIIKMFISSPEYLRLSQENPDRVITTSLESALHPISGSIVNAYNAIVNCIHVALAFHRSAGRIKLLTKNVVVQSAETHYEYIPAGKYVAVIIEDNGERIHEKHYSRLFEPFYLRKTMGKTCTGMELSVVWSIVKDHQGFVDISYDHRCGNRYMLYFPVSSSLEKSSAEEHLGYPAGDYRGNNETILIVDDVDMQRDVCSQFLEELGYRPVAVSGGEEALKYLKERKADLLLIDMVMEPGINGYETLKKALEIHPEQKAVITSGNVSSLLIEKSLKLGAREFIKKPFSLEDIGRAVKKGLSA